MPPEAIPWFLAMRYTGWTLEYIKGLTLTDLAIESAIQGAIAKMREYEREQAKNKSRRRGRRY